jgi:hypothetical protein
MGAFFLETDQMKRLSIEQRKALLENENVLKLTDHHVVFTPAFKVKATELYLKGHLAEDIFTSHGIDPGFFKPRYCGYVLKKWGVKYNDQGKFSLREETRGRAHQQSGGDLEDMDVDDLKAIIRIQQEVISEIKKMKALPKKK